ncbi:MAG TPA: TauD/TfdA family dioxygenase [Beijerinckiaceae bacterium]|jgi:taurine dioxygenase|nr:TauD/TfdA family dioxygenase [Beijerinckiaceae bacterium]
MIHIEPTGEILGARIRDIDLTERLDERDFGRILAALGRYGVIHFPQQNLTPAAQAAFTARFGTIHSSSGFHEPGFPQISILSNIIENGQRIGNPDAGLIWHRDMTYYQTPGFINVLHAHIVPHRDGKPRGPTEFINSSAACDDLPDAIKQRLKGAIGRHDHDLYSASAVAAGSQRQRFETKPKKSSDTFHPILMEHPVTGRTVLYCCPTTVAEIIGPAVGDGEELLQFLREHQLQPKYRWAHSWTKGDVLMWDNLGTLHRVVIDYTAAEPRLMKRAQAKGDKIFDPAFVKAALAGIDVPA